MRRIYLNVLIIILIILLLASIGYILFDKYRTTKAQEQLSFFQQGVQIGYEQAILQLIQQASTCQPVPVFANNQTINMIAVECLNAQ